MNITWFPLKNNFLILVAFTCIMIFNTIFSVIFIIGLWKTNTTLSRPQYIQLLQTVTDLLLTLFGISLIIYGIIETSNVTCTVIIIQKAIIIFLVETAASTTLLLTLDRYLYVARSNFYNQFIAHRYTKRSLVAIISFSLIWCVWVIIIMNEKNIKQVAVFHLCVAVNGGLLLIFLILLNLLLTKYIRNTMKIVRTKTSQNAGNNLKRYDTSVNRTILLLSITLLVHTAPLLIGLCILGAFILQDKQSNDLEHYLGWCTALIFSKPTISLSISIFRNNGIKMFCKSFCRKRENCAVSINMGHTVEK